MPLIHLVLLCASSCLLAVEFPVPFTGDGTRASCDLGGIWEARSTTTDLAWPPASDGWQPHQVPHEGTRLIAFDAGPYWPEQRSAVVDAQGAPTAKDKAAAWFRRDFTLAGPLPPGMRAILRLDGVSWKHKAVLNDQVLGESVLGLVPHAYDVTTILKPGSNALAIGATNRAPLWDQANGTYIAIFAGANAGIWDRVHLELVPELRCDDIFVRTSVARSRIEIDLELINDGPVAATVRPTVLIREPLGQPVLTLAAASVRLAAGESRTITVGADWLARDLWAPGTPNLHRAEVSLAADGREPDRTAATFGFREFAAKGTDFTINGRRQVLLRTSWLHFGGYPREKTIPKLVDDLSDFNCIRMHAGATNRHVPEMADRTGNMVIPEFWGWYRRSDKDFPIAKAALWQDNTAETMRRLVRRYRNHPSIIMWSLANETMWDTVTPPHMAVCDLLVKTVRAADPTRLLQGDAEVTWDGRLDAISVHYPEGDPGPLSRRYGMSGWVMPNDLAWLQREGRSRCWRGDFTWDRPLMFGEIWLGGSGGPGERHSSYAGDDAFDRHLWRWTQWDGRGAPTTFGSPFIDTVKMSFDHYRAAGVACLNPWTGIGSQLMPRLLVAPLDHHPNLFGGEESQRRFFVANDHHQEWTGMHLQAGLLVDGREIWAENGIPAQCGPGEGKHLTLTLRPPPVERAVRARLVVRLRWTRVKTPMELHRHEEDVWLMPRPKLAGVDAGEIALIDGADGATARVLATMGLRLEPGKADEASLAGKRLLILGAGAASGDLPAVAPFVARGGRVLVLHQTALPGLVPGQPALDPAHAASFSWQHDPHPALAGLDEGQLRFWRPDHLVATETLVRPAAGGALAPVACGGRLGMHWSPLVEVRHGAGSVVFCQYLLVDRAAVEPAAATILAQAVRSALEGAARPSAPPLRLIGVAKEALAVLTAAQVDTSPGADGPGPALLDAASQPDAVLVRRLRSEVEAGGTLWLRGLDDKTLPAVRELLPWTPTFSPLPANIVVAGRRSDHPLISGLGSADMYWARGYGEGSPTTPLGGPVIGLPSVDGAVVLTEPALLVAVPLGRGWLLLDQLAWDRALAAEPERATRIANVLARNAGAGFRLAGETGRRYRSTGLDLSAQANRDYVDEIAGDGAGGWTDQGENDMRFFLTNHLSTIDGAVGGLAVPAEPFPERITLGGIDWRLTVPRSNRGKAVIVLRSGGHDAAAPASVTGIPAGNALADRLWFLHTAVHGSVNGVAMARYEVVYADGSRIAVPVHLGQEIGDWSKPKTQPGAQVVWTGRNRTSDLVGLYALAWDNPQPGKPIASIDVIGDLTPSQLVLLAITLGVAIDAPAK